MKPSELHKNRQAYNWLIYDNFDKWLMEYSKYYKGILVDLGCGEAPYKDFFLQFTDEYIGVDWTNTLHDSKADIASNLNEKIELPDKYADTVISISVMEHLCEPQIFLNESHRILKDGGMIILQVPWMWHVHEAPYDYFRYTPYGLKYMFEKAGYEDIYVQPVTGFFTMWFLKMNYFSLRWIKGSKVRQVVTKAVLIPIWYIAQKLAPKLDGMHRGWAAESSGFYVVAKKRKYMSRYCPICENFSEIFELYGYELRADAMCPKCGSLERHRLSWLVIKDKYFHDMADKKLLHIAPEEVFRAKFENLFGDNYLTADISGENVKVKMDITDIQYPDNTFDYIYCSHVLEHIVDDRKAMCELRRVLKKDGWAIILVPLCHAKEKTEEDFSIIAPEDRLRVYGHPEHVRNYGKDFVERLAEAGWEVSMIQANNFLTNESIESMGITKAAGEIYFCKKV